MDPRIRLIQDDITKQNVDAIVNAANSSLLGGGGVDGAIHRAGGPSILEACQAIRARQGGCATGEAVITTGGRLPARYVSHAVGPVWNGGHNNEAQLLANCYRNSLELAVKNNIQTIAFPNISTGIYHFPKDKAAAIAVNTTDTFLTANPDSIKTIIFVCFDTGNYGFYEALLNK